MRDSDDTARFTNSHAPEWTANNHLIAKNPPRHHVTVELEGQFYQGTYWVAGQILTVTAKSGAKSRQIGSCNAEDLAATLLKDLARAGKA